MSIRTTFILAALVLSPAVFVTDANARCCFVPRHIVHNPIVLTSAHTSVANAVKPTTITSLPKVPLLTVHPTLVTIHR
jgi:hypothetical protein